MTTKRTSKARARTEKVEQPPVVIHDRDPLNPKVDDNTPVDKLEPVDE